MAKRAWFKRVLGVSLAVAMTIQPLPAEFGGISVVEAAETETSSGYISLEDKKAATDGILEWKADSSDAAFTYAGETATLTASSWGDQGSWSIQWAVQDIDVTAGDWVVEYDIVSTIDKPVMSKLTNFAAADVDTPIIEKSYDLTANTSYHYKETATIEADGKVRLFFNLAGGTGEGTVTISNMKISKASEFINLEEKKAAENGILEFVAEEVSDATFAYAAETATVTATTWGQQDWWSIQWAVQDMAVTEGDWIVEYDIVSTINKTVMSKLTNFGVEDIDTPIIQSTYDLTANTASHYSETATIAADGKVRLFFNLAGGEGEGTVTISNVKLTKAPTKEAPAVASAKKSDKTNGYKVGEAVVLNATEAADWMNAVTSVVVNSKTVAAENLTLDAEAGTITIAADVFTKQNVYDIEISATGYTKADVTVPVYATTVADEDWQPVWSDEFEGTELDETKWSYEIGVKSGDDADPSNSAPTYWGNDEKQYYIEEAVSVADGYLTITGDTLDEETKAQYGITDGHVQYKSGRIRTVTDAGEVLGATTYGRIEAAIALPVSDGYWPAFWMLPTPETTQYYGGWPSSGEIDIMEVVGQRLGDVDGTIHYGGDWTQHVYSGGQYHFEEGTTVETEHVYAVEWEPGEIRWYVDDVLYHIENNWYGADATGLQYSYPAPFNEDFYILLNLAMSGNYVGNVDPTEMGGYMKVDYVRILMDENFDYDVEVTEPVAVEKDTEFFAANGEYADLIKDKDYTTLKDHAYEDGGMVLEDNEVWWSAVNTGAGAAAEVSVVDGAAKVDVTTVGANDYNVQLIQNIPLAQGYTYRITFDAWTDVTVGRTMTVAPSGDCEHGWTKYNPAQTIELGTEKKTYTIDFLMTAASDPSTRLEFVIGGSTGAVYLDNVYVFALTDQQIADSKADGAKDPLANGELVYNGTFDKGTAGLGYWTTEGVEGSTANRDYTVIVGAEDTKLIQSGLLMKQYEDYKLTFDAKTAGTGTVKVALTDENGETVYASTEFELTTTLETCDVNFTVPEGKGTDMGTLTFTFVGEGETVTIDNVSMRRLTNIGVEWDKYEPYPMGKGDDLLAGWTTYDEVFTWATNSVTPEVLDDGSIGFKVRTAPANENWQVMLSKGELALAKDMTYRIRYAVKASAEGQPVTLDIEDSGYNDYYSKTITAGSEWTYVDETFTNTSLASKAIKFYLGSATQECYIYVKDVSIELDAPNPQFKEGKEVSEMKKGTSFKLEFEHDRAVLDKYDSFTYSTEDTDIVEIDEEGNVTALATGEATIVVTSAVGTEYTFVLAVTEDAEEPFVNPFVDVPEGEWYYNFVMFVAKHGLMSGKGETAEGKLFDPSASITRAEFVRILYNKEGTPDVTYSDVFTDVPEGTWFTKAILWAYENGIVSGKGEGLFDVDGEITRLEIAQILYKYAAYKGYDVTSKAATDLNGFVDGDTLVWGHTAMKWATGYNVVTGKNAADGSGLEIAPNGQAIRAEAATMVYKVMAAYEGATLK